LEENILRKECFNDDKFDHTNWYISIFMKHGIMRLRPIRIIADRAFLV
jgi:hypothetical protein